MQQLPTIHQLNANPISKGALADKLYPATSYDCALPQQWLEDAVTATRLDYPMVRGTIVWLYPASHMFGIPAPLCRTTAQALKDAGYTFMLPGGELVNGDA